MNLLNATQGVAKNAERWRICGRARQLKAAALTHLMFAPDAFAADSGAFLMLVEGFPSTSPFAPGMRAVAHYCF